MRVQTYCDLIKKSIMLIPLCINEEYILNPLNIGWEYTTSDTINYYQYEIERIVFNPYQSEPDIHLNSIKPLNDITDRELIYLSDFIPLLNHDIEYHLHPRFYKDENGYRTSDIHDSFIFKIEWDYKNKCYYIL